MAFKTIRKRKSAIAYLFAISILAITTCDIVCSIDRTSMAGANKHDLLALNHHVDGAKSKHHQHDEYQRPHSHDNEVAEQPHAGAHNDQDDDCCKDITNQFYNSLFNGGDVSIVKAPLHAHILLAVVIHHYRLLSSVQYVNPLGVLLKIPPNSVGHRLRILISSFLI